MSELTQRTEFNGIPGGCHMIGYLHECMAGEDHDRLGEAAETLIACPSPPSQEDIRSFHKNFGVDSLTLIEMGMVIEDCATCVHGLGSGACRLGDVIVKF